MKNSINILIISALSMLLLSGWGKEQRISTLPKSS